MVVCTSEPAEAVLPRFYAGRDLFITGATGFMGKVLLERLLSTCPDIGQVFLLMRDKRGQTPQKRLAQMKQSQVFDSIRAHSPNQLDKLVGLTGDVTKPLLGLGAQEIAQLTKVSVVFHNAATVKFWEPLDVAVSNNVTSVISLMDLCDQLPSLEALVHVSTAFTNVELRHIEERVYPADAKLSQVQELLKTLPTDILSDITPKYIHPKPNTYVFTKALAEAAVNERQGRSYSVAIFRPSIVVSSHLAPVPGWIEGLAGASGVVVGIGQGLLRVFNLNFDARAELVPVDIVIDNMIAVAWETATEKLKEPRVYYCGSQENPITWLQFSTYMQRTCCENPFDNIIYYPAAYGIKNKYVYKFLEVFLQTAPLYIAEYIFKICGVKTPMSLITASQRLRAMTSVLAFFSCQEWTFDVTNVRRLRERLQKTDGHLYHLNINDVKYMSMEAEETPAHVLLHCKSVSNQRAKLLNSPETMKEVLRNIGPLLSFWTELRCWEEHTQNFVRGARKYILRQKDDALPLARKRVERLQMVHHGVLLLLALICYKLVMFFLQRFF